LPEDREAIGQRLMHLKINPESITYLKSLGGIDFTGKKGQRWIKGDSGKPSDYIVAKHFLWLHENRPARNPDHRFLVDGDSSSIVIRNMAINSGTGPLVIETLLNILNQAGIPNDVVVKDGKYLTTAFAILKFYRKIRLPGSADLTAKIIGSSLRGLADSNWDLSGKQSIQTLNSGDIKKARWWSIDLDILLDQAETYGFDCDRLNELINERDQLKN